MMKQLRSNKAALDENAVSTTIEYISITAIVMALLIVLMLTMNSVFMEGPRDLVSYHSFVDIGNGVSTRIVDVYVLAPFVKVEQGSIRTKFSIPDEVARASYDVDLTPPLAGSPGSETIVVSRGSVKSTTSLAGIGSTLGASGSTTGMGMKIICYNSSGGGCAP
jgi:hypothetical protein